MLTPMPNKTYKRSYNTPQPSHTIDIKSPALPSKITRGSSWNLTVEKEILDFAETCGKDSERFKKTGKRMKQIGKCVQLTLIISGATSVLMSGLGSLSEQSRLITTGILGAITSILGSISSIYKFDNKGLIYEQVGEGLESLDRSIRMETYKPANMRTNPSELLLFGEETRTKLIKRCE